MYIRKLFCFPLLQVCIYRQSYFAPPKSQLMG